MSDKHYVGKDLVSFADKGKYKPVSRVTLIIDDENCVTAGDDTGKELVATCYNATQAMADALLARFRGYEYQAYEVAAANLNPAAELGDGLTADGHYVTISRMDDDGSGYPSPSAPGEAELEDEYPSAGPMTQEFNRKIATTNARITKTASDIRLEVTDSLNQLSASITAELQAITQTVTGLNGKYTELQTTVDGVTVTTANEDGTKTITLKNGIVTADAIAAGAITADKIAAGAITADSINLAGAITWNDLAPGVQSTINGAYNSGLSASEVKTIINSQLVLSPTIAGGKFCNLAQDAFFKVESAAEGGNNFSFYTASGSNVAFRASYDDELAPNLTLMSADWPFLNVYGGSGFVVAEGNWNFTNGTMIVSNAEFVGTVDFSEATITGLNTSGDITVTAVWG